MSTPHLDKCHGSCLWEEEVIPGSSLVLRPLRIPRLSIAVIVKLARSLNRMKGAKKHRLDGASRYWHEQMSFNAVCCPLSPACSAGSHSATFLPFGSMKVSYYELISYAGTGKAEAYLAALYTLTSSFAWIDKLKQCGVQHVSRRTSALCWRHV